ncbi:MAG: biotin--[acetyl-CoA-carboxylase] ligase [Clostridia bacterium]|nr:biotin--[acetyl-CoA-carboxylase] ligase [Clostridia bacterium]
MVKDIVLQRLKEDTSRYISGEVLSEMLGVSRTAIWKYINELKKDGYEIESSSKKGYKLISASDIINATEIGYNLGTRILAKKIEYFGVIDSTNNYAKQAAAEGCGDGTVIVAESQTSGRGRLGRAWDSAGKKGIWLSVVLRPSIAPEDIHLITLAASVAVVKAVKQATGIETGIKWPNDVVLGGKKVCGILTEMSSEMERVNFLVLGIGINVNHETEDFPEGLRDTAVSLASYADKNLDGAVCKTPFNRAYIIRTLLEELEKIYIKINEGSTEEIVEEWKKYSVTLGNEVRVTIKNNQYTGIARDITEDGKLIVSCSDGITREVISGEIMVRGILGYV